MWPRSYGATESVQNLYTSLAMTFPLTLSFDFDFSIESKVVGAPGNFLSSQFEIPGC